MCPSATCGRSWRILYGSEHGLYMFQHVSSQQCTFAIRIEPVWECILRIGLVGGNVDKNPFNPKFKIVCRAYNHFKLKPCCRPKQSCMSCVKTLTFRAHEPSLPGTIPTTMFALFELITAPDLAPYRVPWPGVSGGWGKNAKCSHEHSIIKISNSNKITITIKYISLVGSDMDEFRGVDRFGTSWKERLASTYIYVSPMTIMMISTHASPFLWGSFRILDSDDPVFFLNHVSVWKEAMFANPPLVVFLVIFIILGSFGLLDSTRGDGSKSVKFCRFRGSYKVFKSYKEI